MSELDVIGWFAAFIIVVIVVAFLYVALKAILITISFYRAFKRKNMNPNISFIPFVRWVYFSRAVGLPTLVGVGVILADFLTLFTIILSINDPLVSVASMFSTISRACKIAVAVKSADSFGYKGFVWVALSLFLPDIVIMIAPFSKEPEVVVTGDYFY